MLVGPFFNMAKRMYLRQRLREMPADRRLGIRQVAELLSTTTDGVYRLSEQGRLRLDKEADGTHVVRAGDLLRALQDGKL
jgi:hypothetical protein